MLDAAGNLIAAVPAALNLGVAAMGFDRAAFARVGDGSVARDLALVMVFLAGVSQAVGHGMVLFFNRVPKGRFALSLCLAGAVYTASALVTAFTTTLVADYAFGADVPLWPTIGVIALAHAPRLLGVFTLAPYFGEGLNRVIDIWVLVLTPFGLHYGLAVPVQAGILSALIGWLAIRILLLLFGQPLGWLLGHLRRAAAGNAMALDAHNIVEVLKARAREAVGLREGGE